MSNIRILKYFLLLSLVLLVSGFVSAFESLNVTHVYSFEECDAGDVVDSITDNQVNLSTIGTVGNVSGIRGCARSNGGTKLNRIENTSTSFNWTDSYPFTVSYWVNNKGSINDTNPEGIVYWSTPASDYVIYSAKYKGAVHIGSSNTNTNTSPDYLTNNDTWVNIIAVGVDATHYLIYYNGVLRGNNTDAYKNNLSAYKRVRLLSDANNARGFNGYLDEVYFFKGQPSSNDITQLSNSNNVTAFYPFNVSPPEPPPVNNSPNLQLYYDFEQNTSTQVIDKSNQGNNGTLENVTINTSYGKYFNGVNFNTNVSSDISVPDADALSPQYFGNATWSLWIKRNENKANRYAFGKGGTSNWEYGLRDLGTNIYGFIIFNYSGSSNFAGVNCNVSGVNTWDLVTLVYINYTSLSCYVNGVYQSNASINAGTSLVNGNKVLLIGKRNSADLSWNGSIDEFRIYNYALNQSEIVALYEGSVRVNFTSASPSGDISSLYLMDKSLTLQYNYSIDGLNVSTARVESRIISPISSCLHFINGICILANNTLYNITLSNNQSSGVNDMIVNFTLGENDVYFKTENLNESTLSLSDGTNTMANNELVRDEIINVSSSNAFGVYEAMINRTSGTGNMILYYCNSSYSTGNPAVNGNCLEIFNGVVLGFNHTHNVFLKHNFFPFRIINGKVNNIIPVTSKSYFISSGAGYTYHMSVDTARTGALATSTNNGNAWTNSTNTYKSHVHLFSGSDYVQYRAIGKYLDGSWYYSGFNSQNVVVQYLPPTNPAIIDPINNHINNRFMIVNWSNASVNDPTANISKYRIDLLNNDSSLNLTLASSFNGSDTYSLRIADKNYSTTSNVAVLLYNVTINALISGGSWSYADTGTGTSDTYATIMYDNGSYINTSVCGTSASSTCAFNNLLGRHARYIEFYGRTNAPSTSMRLFGQGANINLKYFGFNGEYLFDIYQYNLSIGDYKVKVSVNDTYGGTTSDIESFTLDTNKLLVVNVYDPDISLHIVDYVLNVTDLSNLVSQSFNVLGSDFWFNGIKGRQYEFLVDAPDYAYVFENITLNDSSLEYHDFNLDLTNSVNITVSDEDSSALIVQNVSVRFVLRGTSTVYDYVTATGLLFVSNLTAGTYDVFFTSTTPLSYGNRQYTLTINDRSTQSLNAFMILGAFSAGFYIKSITDNAIVGASFTVSKLFNGSYVVIGADLTDVTGYVTFQLKDGQEYKFTISASGYTPREFLMKPYAINSPYTFKLSLLNTQVFINPFNYLSYRVLPDMQLLNRTNYTFSLTSLSTNGTIYNTSINCSGNYDFVSGSPSGATVSTNFNVSAYSSVVCDYKIYFDSPLSNGTVQHLIWSRSYPVQKVVPTFLSGAKNIKDQINNQAWTTILAYCIIFFITFIVFGWSNGNTTIVAVTMIAGIVVFASISWIDPLIGGIVAFVGAMLLFMSGRT